MMSPLSASRTKQRIIRRAVQFDCGHLARLRQRIAHCTVHLRRAPQAVRILHARIFFRCAMRLANLAALIQVRNIPRCRRGTRIRARMHDARIERTGTTAQRIQRKGSGHIRGVHEDVRLMQRQTQQRQHALCPIQKRKAFFRFQRDRRNSRALHGFAPGQKFSPKRRAALASDYLCEMRQWREVARSPHRTLRRNHGVHLGV
jgi:hypothetical protein